jgi:transcriptional regulator of heat shock response
MAALEAEGYLAQPHTSAGRIPTEKGYRFFVDQLGGPGKLGVSESQQVRTFFNRTHGEMEQMLSDTSRLLSSLTHYAAVVVGPQHEVATIKSVQLVGLSPRLVHGVMTRDFPNLLMISTVQGGFGTNFVHYLTETSKHCAAIIRMCLDEDITQIEPSANAEEDWFNVLMSKVMGVGMYNASCTPGYLNREQQAGDMKAARAASFMGSVEEYADHLIAWREAGELVGVEVTKAK